MGALCAVLLVLAVGSTLLAQPDALAPNPDPGTSEEVIDPNDAAGGLLERLFDQVHRVPQG